MNNDLETILDACLNQIEEGVSNIEECLARYPEQAMQLEPLLKAATTLARAREVVPDPSYKARSRTQLNIYMQQHPQRKRVSTVFWRVAVGLVTVMLLFLASGTTFAQSAVPGDTIYDWKLSSEQVWRMTSSDQLGVDLSISNRRAEELVRVYGDQSRRAHALQNYERLLVKFQNEKDQNKKQRILPVLRIQHQWLIKAGISLPELENYFPH